MGVYIDMEMPENCFDCPFMYGRKYCLLDSKIEFNDPEYSELKNRYKGCPLIEVREPHGPLYDLYDIFDNMQHSRGIDINCSSPGMTADLFQGYAPVIPASKEG